VFRAEHAATGSDKLTRSVVENYYKLLAYKDEYEVARLHSRKQRIEALRAQFGKRPKIDYYLSPPLIAPRDVNGTRGKRRFSGWYMLLLFRVLASMRALRGTLFDPFGYQDERKRERSAIGFYRRAIEQMLPRLSAKNIEQAIAFANVPSTIKGFGHVKLVAEQAAEVSYRSALEAFERLT
jgi:indolepyruvate ferredoxin oxidoreductase